MTLEIIETLEAEEVEEAPVQHGAIYRQRAVIRSKTKYIILLL